MQTRRKKHVRKKAQVGRFSQNCADYCSRDWPRGQRHHKAKLTDHEVDIVLELRSEGWLYREIAEKMETPISTVRDICKGLTRYRCG